MLVSDRFIVFNYTRFSDSSIILHALSQQHGRLSVMVYGFGSKGKSKLVAFHPFSLIDTVYSFKPGRDIQKLKEYKINPLLTNCISDIRKSTILIFLSEITAKSVREETPDPQLFGFVEKSIEMLELMETGLAYFHLAFLVKLSRYLGFSPNSDSLQQPFFDLVSGHGIQQKPAHGHYLHQPMFEKLYQLLTLNYNQLDTLSWNRNERDTLMEAILNWYSFHVSGLKTIHSYQVLREIFA